MDIFNIIGNETRRKILSRLSCHECYLSSLSEGFEISHTAISKHLNKLKEEGIIEPEEGKEDMKKIFYRITESKLVTSVVSSHLASFNEYEIPEKESLEEDGDLEEDIKRFKSISDEIDDMYKKIADLEGTRNLLMSRIKDEYDDERTRQTPEMIILHYLLLKGDCTYEELSNYLNIDESEVRNSVDKLKERVDLKVEDSKVKLKN